VSVMGQGQYPIFREALSVKKLLYIYLKRVARRSRKCIGFIQYANKNNIGVAAEGVYESLQKVLKFNYSSGTTVKILAKPDKSRIPRIMLDYVRLIFRVIPAGCPLRTLAVQSVLSYTGMKVCLRARERSIWNCCRNTLATEPASSLLSSGHTQSQA
jgi:hypothetical protein